MRASRIENKIVLEFGMLEKVVLLHAFQSIRLNYRLKPEELDPKGARVLYSTRGCETAGMNAEETREWLQSLRDFKGSNLALLEKWIGEMSQDAADPFALTLSVEQAHILLTVLNDHRLLTASQSDIEATEMELHSLKDFEQLPSQKQSALYEIHFLAWIMEELLRLAAPDAANWKAAAGSRED